MDETTRRVLQDLKNLTDTRKEMEAQGLLTPFELRRKIKIEEQMKWEIAYCMRLAQKKIDDKKREEEKLIGQLTYKLGRKIREMNRLQEEEDYRQEVEERYEARIKKEKEEEEKMKKEKEEKEVDKKENDEKKDEKKEEKVESKIKKNRKKNKRGGNKKSSETDNDGLDGLNVESLSL